jgi:hypothetical protein
MRTAVGLAFLLAFGALADEPADRAAIDRLIGAFNDPSRPVGDLFAAGAPDNSAELAKLGRTGAVWSEVSYPHLLVRAVRFENSRRAVVDTDNVRYGSVVMVKRAPVTLILRRQRGQWKIFSLHVAPDF